MTTRLSATFVGPGADSPNKTKGKTVPPMPSHWIFERDGHPSGHAYFCWWPLPHFLHHLFCSISFGHSNMRDVWKNSYPDCSTERWEKVRMELRERLEHINLMVRFSSVSISILWVLTTISGLGCFDPGCNDGIRHHRASHQRNTTVYGSSPLLHLLSSY